MKVEMGRGKGEGEDSGKLGGKEWVGWRKGGYGNREIHTLIKGAIFRVCKRLIFRGVPRYKGRSPYCSLGSRGEDA